ncbi:hypothetical protein C8Q76DRAFT_328942 [Earliella scabrosa]|nr:hypothetical protein C8Q76DRAFT_328942 [Earliella scabrosa]
MDDPWLAIRMEPRKDYYLLLMLLWISFASARVDARRARLIPYVLLSLAHSPPPLARTLAAASPALAAAYPWMIVFMSSKAAAPPRARDAPIQSACSLLLRYCRCWPSAPLPLPAACSRSRSCSILPPCSLATRLVRLLPRLSSSVLPVTPHCRPSLVGADQTRAGMGGR